MNQCILNLIVESQASIPVHMSAASGNSDDKTGFRSLVKSHVRQLQNVTGYEYLVADSALYAEETLKELDSRVMFITRMPETLTIARELLQQVEVASMYQIDDNYRYQEVCGVYGGVKQRWIIVYSQKAYERDLETLNRKTLKGSEAEQKAFTKLCHRAFACPEDAMREWEKFQGTLHYTVVHELKVSQQPHYGHRGKPKQGEAPERIDYFLTGSVASCFTKRAQMLRTQGMFVLPTNELDSDCLPAPDVLHGYKGQLHVEKGFKFLKNHEFLASALFLKKPERIMALLMIMTLCLMVYAALEYRIRKLLKEQGLTVLNQVKKPTNRPTARWVFHWFVGIHVLYRDGQCLGVLNLEDKHWQIINLLGYQDYYT